MAHRITKISELKKYLREMMFGTGRAGDSYPRILHAPAVSPELVGTIGINLIIYADDDTIEIGTRTNGAGVVHEVNQLWFTVQARPWAIVYSATNGRIELRSRNKQGPAMHALDKTSTPAQVAAVFAAL